MRWLALVAITLVVIYAASGMAVVQQDELGVVRRFGAVLAEPWQPGLHVGLPWPLDQLDRVKIGQTRILTVGAAASNAAPLSRSPDPQADDRMTGDLNLVTAQAQVHYRVEDPVAFLFSARSAEAALSTATESALTQALAARGIDDVLTIGRAEVAEQIARSVRDEAQRLRIGTSVRAVRLGRVTPPTAVAPAFTDAARARSDRRQAVTTAEEYRDRSLADAAGKAREVADRAAARHDRAVEIAHGEADRFAKVLGEERKAPVATRQRLYLEALATLLPRFARKVVVEPGKDVDLGLITSEPPADPVTPGGP